MCKGHPGKREAAVDSEINKQKAKGREELWRAGPGDRGVNYRPISPRHTPKTVASKGTLRFSMSFTVCLYYKLLFLFVACPFSAHL